MSLQKILMNTAQTATKGVALAVTLPLILPVGIWCNLVQKPIPEYEKSFVLEQEAAKLGVDPEVILVNSDTERLSAGILPEALAESTGKKYRLNLPRGATTKGNIRHELYHAAKGHCERVAEHGNEFLDSLHSIMVREPTAALYSVLG